MEKELEEVCAVSCRKAFVVAPGKIEEFKNSRPNPQIRQEMTEMVEKFRENLIITKGPILKKTIGYNKR